MQPILGTGRAEIRPAELKIVEPLVIIGAQPKPKGGTSMYRNGIKRLLAVILSLGGMICLSPLLLVLCIAIKLDSPGPVFFKQKRVGIHK